MNQPLPTAGSRLSLCVVRAANGWFEGDESRHDNEARFLAAIRVAGAKGGLEDVTAASTSVMPLNGFVPMLLRVEVPGLLQPSPTSRSDTPTTTQTWTGWSANGVTCTYWTTTAGSRTTSPSRVSTPDPSNTHASRQAGCGDSYSDPSVERIDWPHGGRVMRSQWRFGDSGKTLASQGGFLHRLTRAEQRVSRVRG